MTMTMRQRQRAGTRYLAALVMAMSVMFLVVGTLGPARHSPFYWAIVPPPALMAFLLGWRAWSSERRSTIYCAAALALLILVLFFSHLLPRSGT